MEDILYQKLIRIIIVERGERRGERDLILFLSTGGGTVQFDSDDECTDFVHLFFPHCSKHIPSCSKVQNDQVKVKRVL